MTDAPVTTIVSAAASYDLTDLTTAKDELSIGGGNAGDDAWLRRAVSQVSQAISTHTQRVMVPEVVQDMFDFSRSGRWVDRLVRSSELQLSRRPLIEIVSVTLQLSTGWPQTLVAGTDFRVDSDKGQLIRLDAPTGYEASWERVPTAVVYLAGYGAGAVESAVVPASPYQVTVAQSAVFSCDRSVTYANGTALTRVTANPALAQYSVAAGVYTFAAADVGQHLTIAYATKNIPADLVDISLQLVTARYRAKGRDPSLVQRETPGVGMERWWFGGAPGQSGPFPPDIEGALERYRSVVFA